MGQAPYVALHPPEGAVYFLEGDERPVELSPATLGQPDARLRRRSR